MKKKQVLTSDYSRQNWKFACHFQKLEQKWRNLNKKYVQSRLWLCDGRAQMSNTLISIEAVEADDSAGQFNVARIVTCHVH